MIRLKLLLEISDKIKNLVKDKWKSVGFNLTDNQFDYYISIFEKNQNNKVFPSSDIMRYTFKESNPTKKEYTFKDLELTVDANFSKNDYKNIKYDHSKDNLSYNKDVIYNQDDLIIWDADTKEKCIKYGKYGKEYCISRPDNNNMYNNYRYTNRLTFYFVMDKSKKESDPWSFFSIAVPDRVDLNNTTKKQYYVTDRFNRYGDGVESNTTLSWEKIIQHTPKLNGYQDIFKSKDLSDEEYNKYEKLSYELDDNEYKILSFDDKMFYIDLGHKLSEIKFKNSPEKIQNKYIEMGHIHVGNWYDDLNYKQQIVLDKIASKTGKVIAKKYGWTNNILNGKYSSNSDVDITDDMIYRGRMIFSFDTVNGDFNCRKTSLITLKGAPTIVKDNFICEGCTSLTSLKGCPKEIGGYFNCDGCKSLTTLEGAPITVGRSFSCNECTSLTSLKGCPTEIGAYFSCSECTSLTTLEGAPTKIDGYFNCDGCKSLTTLKGAPRIVQSFFCSGCKSLTTLEGAPRIVKIFFECGNCDSLITLEGCPKEIGGYFSCDGCISLKSLEGCPTKVGGYFDCNYCTSLGSLKYLPIATKYVVPSHLESQLISILNYRKNA